MAGTRDRRPTCRQAPLAGLWCAWLSLAMVGARQRRPAQEITSRRDAPREISLKPAQSENLALGDVKAGETYRLVITLESGTLAVEDRVRVELIGAGPDKISKDLHAGDPDLYLPYRPRTTASHA